MRFAAILTGVTILTLISIFGVYKLFLYKSSPQSSEGQIITTNNSEATQSLPVSSAAPAVKVIASPTLSPSAKPKVSSTRSTIGTLTVLQNTVSQSSSATAQSSTISGTINFTGTAPTGTSIVIVARLSGTSDSYKTVVSGISATNGASWSWTSAQNGKAYDMIAILKGSSGGIDTDYAASQTYIVTAPAFLQIFSVNASVAPTAPTGAITTTCATHLSNNTWTAAVNFETVTGAQSYKLQVGTTSGASDVVNVSQAAQSGTTQNTNTTLTDSILYYAQYALATAPNPTAAQYSPFSTPITIKCPS
jgi:hypothetical protein